MWTFGSWNRHICQGTPPHPSLSAHSTTKIQLANAFLVHFGENVPKEQSKWDPESVERSGSFKGVALALSATRVQRLPPGRDAVAAGFFSFSESSSACRLRWFLAVCLEGAREPTGSHGALLLLLSVCTSWVLTATFLLNLRLLWRFSLNDLHFFFFCFIYFGASQAHKITGHCQCGNNHAASFPICIFAHSPPHTVNQSFPVFISQSKQTRIGCTWRLSYQPPFSQGG